MSGILSEVRASVCCKIVQPLWQWVAAWVSATWCLLLCTLPGGILGRKRFTSKPWGGEVLKAAELADEEALAKEMAILKGIVGGLEGEGGAASPTADSLGGDSVAISMTSRENTTTMASTTTTTAAAAAAAADSTSTAAVTLSSSKTPRSVLSGSRESGMPVGGLNTRFVAPKLDFGGDDDEGGGGDKLTKTNTEVNAGSGFGKTLSLPINSPKSR